MTETGRRTIALLAALAAVAAPALLLRVLCVGRSCEERARPMTRVPFCSLPPTIRERLAAGFRDGRSPDVLAVTAADTQVAGADGYERLAPLWPHLGPEDAARVPLVFVGEGVTGEVPAETTLSRVAPTVAAAMRLERPFPEVRSGTPIEEVAFAAAPRLTLLVVWKGIGSADLDAAPSAWPALERWLDAGVGTLGADAGSLPIDPTAVLTTIGTGGLPSEHGITGAVVRNDDGEAVEAWSRTAPFSVIAALGDDLDEVLGQAPRVGIVSTSPLDRGAIGEDWYVEHDADHEVIVGSAEEAVRAAVNLLRGGYGADEVPDLLAVVLDGPIRSLDRATRDIARGAARATATSPSDEPVLLVVTSTGSMEPPTEPIPAVGIAEAVERAAGVPGVVESLATGGLFLDQEALVAAGASEDGVIRALRRVEMGRVVADAFSGTAIELREFCT